MLGISARIFYIALALIGLAFGLIGCADTSSDVPVTEAWRQSVDSPTNYVVQPGDTLYSVAWNYGLDYRQVAAANGIAAPAYAIHVGQKLHLLPPKKVRSQKAILKNSKSIQQKFTPTDQAQVSGDNSKLDVSSTTATDIQQDIADESAVPAPVIAATKVLAVSTQKNAGINWAWPARGKIINTYCATSLNKGVDIAAKLNAPVLAAAAGKVVYAGNGLRGYGQLLIIKHNDEFLSAYAHNQKLMVQEGQTVRVGQIVALMGNTEAQCVALHFEIRKAGKPVDPLKYLPKR